MKWDKRLSEKYKELSVKSSSEMVVGQTYFGNWCQSFVYLGPDKRGFFKYKTTSKFAGEIVMSTSYEDNNVDGGGYNPWFIFADQETAVACRKELNPTFEYPKNERFWQSINWEVERDND